MNEVMNRPYAPAASVVDVIRRFRRRNLPEVVDPPYLLSAGLSKEISTRVLGAIRFLGLIDEEGHPSESLRMLARTTDEEYKTTLETVVRGAYAEVFTVVDPREDGQVKIVNAFRRYEPASQHYRMAVLFLGLCTEAGISLAEEPRKREVQTRPVARDASGGGRAAAKRGTPARGFPAKPGQSVTYPAQGSAVLSGYFARLPKPGSVFSGRDRERWLEGMRSALELEYAEGDGGDTDE